MTFLSPPLIFIDEEIRLFRQLAIIFQILRSLF
jgi:hypothetical protein